MAGEITSNFEHCQLAAVLANGDLVSDAYLKCRNVDLAAVYGDVPVANYLTRLASRSCKTHAVGDVIEATLKLLQEEFAGDTRLAGGSFEVVAELLFQREIDALGLLLLTELESVANDLGFAVFSVLSGGEIALLYRTLFSETLCSLEEQLHAFATAKATYRTFITCQLSILLSSIDRFTGWLSLHSRSVFQSRVASHESRITSL